MRPVNPESANRANSSLTPWFGIFRPIAKKGASVARLPGSVMQDFRKELLSALRARLSEEILLRGVFDDLAAVHEDDAVRDHSGEAHLVRDHHHGHAFFCELDHHV